MTSRRAFLKTASAAALAAPAVHPFLAWAADPSAISVPGKDGMIVRSYRFLDLEAPVEFMTDWITPVNHFFVRNHMFEPAKIETSTWKLTIGGEVEKPLTLTLADLQKVPVHSVTNIMECAGNGRSLQSPKVPGIQWGKGAVGNAKFSGPSLKVLLEKADVKDTGKHVMFRGLDEVPGKVPPFIRSIPIEKAIDADTLIATHMNGAPLTHHHGFPARVITPGWAGAASCKWLTEITVLDKPAEVGKDHVRYAWRLWSYAWRPAKSGDYVILSRATDSQGRIQPDAAVWNPSGYLYNAYDQVKVYVQA